MSLTPILEVPGENYIEILSALYKTSVDRRRMFYSNGNLREMLGGSGLVIIVLTVHSVAWVCLFFRRCDRRVSTSGTTKKGCVLNWCCTWRWWTQWACSDRWIWTPRRRSPGDARFLWLCWRNTTFLWSTMDWRRRGEASLEGLDSSVVADSSPPMDRSRIFLIKVHSFQRKVSIRVKWTRTRAWTFSITRSAPFSTKSVRRFCTLKWQTLSSVRCLRLCCSIQVRRPEGVNQKYTSFSCW